MFAWGAAPFLQQKGRFSCHDAHAFNRLRSTQVTVPIQSSEFDLVTRGFSCAVSLLVPSSHEPESLVL